MDANSVVLGIDTESDQDVELQFCGPDRDGLGALWVGQLERRVVCDLDCWRQSTGEGA